MNAAQLAKCQTTAQMVGGLRKELKMNAYTIDQERKRASVETRLHSRYPGVDLDIFNLPGLLRIVAHFGTVQLIADHDLKYNVFALVKMFAEDIERAALAADVIRQKGGHF